MIRFIREDDERLERAARLVSDAAPRLSVDAELFETRLMREIRARASAPTPAPLFVTPRIALRPMALAATLALMVVAGAMSVMVGVPVSPPRDAASTQAGGLTDEVSELEDAVSSPREVPFFVEGDLLGARRGSIPLTTYVLEPPPEQDAVLRASL